MVEVQMSIAELEQAIKEERESLNADEVRLEGLEKALEELKAAETPEPAAEVTGGDSAGPVSDNPEGLSPGTPTATPEDVVTSDTTATPETATPAENVAAPGGDVQPAQDIATAPFETTGNIAPVEGPATDVPPNGPSLVASVLDLPTTTFNDLRDRFVTMMTDLYGAAVKVDRDAGHFIVSIAGQIKHLFTFNEDELSMNADYPCMMYRDGIQGIAQDAAQADAMIAEGWSKTA